MRAGGVLVLGWLAACGDNLRLHADGAVSASADASHDANEISDAVDAAPDASFGNQNEGATSGTRLKLVWYQTPDGVKTFLGTSRGPGYHDAQRGEDCNASLWDDGNTYCTPGSMQAAYSDAACTAVIGRGFVSTSTCGTPPPLPGYIVEVATGCGNAFAHLYERGAPATTSQYYTRNATGACSGPFTDMAYQLYTAGAEVAPAALVQMTVGAPQGSGTVQLEWWQTADGLRAPEWGYDTTLAEDCVPFSTWSGGTICAPRPSPASTVFHDATCTQRELAVTTACQVPKSSLVLSDLNCPKPTATFYPVGAATGSAPLYRLNGANACQAVTANPADTYYSLGARITPTPLAYETDTTAGRRLELHHFTAADFSLRDRTLFDTMFDDDCQLLTLNDGTTACLPLNRQAAISGATTQLGAARTGVVSGFAGAGCTLPVTLVQVYNGATSCEPITTPGFALTWTTDNGCSMPEVHRVGAAFAGPVYDTNCAVFTDPRFTFYDGSTIVPNSALATATRVVDP